MRVVARAIAMTLLAACSQLAKPATMPATSEPPIEDPPPPRPAVPGPHELPAPWTGPKLLAADAKAIVGEWKRAKNKATCAALAFADIGGVGKATPRKATFAGGWAVAWDKKGLPG